MKLNPAARAVVSFPDRYAPARHPLEPDALPRWLSCFPEKLACYAADEAFCAGWRTIEAMERDGTLVLSRLWNIGSVLFKSDSLLRGNTRIGMDALAHAGFHVRVGREVTFPPPLVREFWRYSLGRYSDERIALLARLLSEAPSLYLLVEAERPDERVPTALRLTDFKGEPVPELRAPGKLRSALGPPQSALLNYVHTGDEPADVVRELGLLFDQAERRRCLADALAGSGAAARALCDRLLPCAASRVDLDFESALKRVRERLSLRLSATEARWAHVIARLEQVGRGESDAWSPLKLTLSEFGVDIDPLDDIVIRARLVPLKKAQPTQPFPSCELRHWREYGVRSPMDPAR